MSFPSPSLTPSKRLSSPLKNRAGPLIQSQFAESTARLLAKLEGLRNECVTDRFYQRNGTITDIFSLPVELLAEIFYIAHYQCGPLHTFDRTSAPFNLTQTCRLWRTISLEKPRLWNTILFSMTVSPKILELWFDRANGPVNLYLADLNVPLSRPRTGHPSDLREGALWGVVKDYAAEIQHLHFTGTFTHRLFLHPLHAHMFPRLKSVEWVMEPSRCGRRAADSYERFWENACSAPSIRKAKIEQIPKCAPWSQLVELDLLFSPFRPGIRALSQCRNLKKLFWCLRKPRISPMKPIVIPKLDDLFVSFKCYHTSLLFDCLSLPSLSRLAVGRMCGITPDMLESAYKLLGRSNAILRSFDVALVTQDGEEIELLVPFLQAPLLCNLRVFSINIVETPDRLWTALATPSFLPQLQELHLGIHTASDINLIMSSLRMRQSTPNKLNRVVLSIYDYDSYNSDVEGPRFARLDESWYAMSSQLADLLTVDIVPWSRSSTFAIC